VNQMNVVPSYPPSSAPAPVGFSGDRGEFFGLVTRGAALELVTVGFYRFWLATDIRRHLWANTVIDGDAVEYTGRGKELLIGFLFALAILVPFYLIYLLISIEATRFQAFAGTPLFLAIYAFGQFAIYRARRYRLTRTVWRGVRFWMDGSGWAYSVRAMGWGLLVLLTLGLLLPWREAALERYKMQHTHYGDLQGSFEGEGWEFFKRGWWLWLLSPVAYVIPFLAPFVYAAYKAVEWRWWLSGIRFGGVRLESTMTRGALIGLYWKVVGWVVLLGLALAAYAWLCVSLVASADGTSLEVFFTSQAAARSIPLLALIGAGYLVFVLAMNVVVRVYLVHDLWVKVVGSVDVQGIEAAANVAARGDLASALGEGLADSLDVAGF